MLFGGTPTMTNTYTRGNIVSDDNKVEISTDLIVQGRDILFELDNLHKSMLLLPRDQKLEDKYPELKEAYDAYQDLYRGIMIADKMREVE
tara:strand:- start:483 stop:752 length:270 start_codon:yes stop_codon:yes gene_type:complete